MQNSISDMKIQFKSLNYSTVEQISDDIRMRLYYY